MCYFTTVEYHLTKKKILQSISVKSIIYFSAQDEISLPDWRSGAGRKHCSNVMKQYNKDRIRNDYLIKVYSFLLQNMSHNVCTKDNLDPSVT